MSGQVGQGKRNQKPAMKKNNYLNVSIKRLMHRAKIMRVSAQSYEYVRRIVDQYLYRVLSLALRHLIKVENQSTLKERNIMYAMESLGYTTAVSGEGTSRCTLPKKPKKPVKLAQNAVQNAVQNVVQNAIVAAHANARAQVHRGQYKVDPRTKITDNVSRLIVGLQRHDCLVEKGEVFARLARRMIKGTADQLGLTAGGIKVTGDAMKLLQIVTEYFLVDWFTMADQIRHRQGTFAIDPSNTNPFTWNSGFRSGVIRLTVTVKDLESALAIFCKARPLVLNSNDTYEAIAESNAAFMAMNDKRRGLFFLEKDKKLIIKHYAVTFDDEKINKSRLRPKPTVLQLIRTIQYGGEKPSARVQPKMSLQAAKQWLIQRVRAKEAAAMAKK
jgi:histone H3/H4